MEEPLEDSIDLEADVPSSWKSNKPMPEEKEQPLYTGEYVPIVPSLTTDQQLQIQTLDDELIEWFQAYEKNKQRIEENFFINGKMKIENISLYGKKIRDILGFKLDFYIEFLKNKYKLRRTAFYIWQIEVPYAFRLALIEEQEKRTAVH